MRLHIYALILLGSSCIAQAWDSNTFFNQVEHDWRNHYSAPTLVNTGLLLGVSGTFANTGLDRGVQRLWHPHDTQSDPKRMEIGNQFGGLNQFFNMIPLYVGSDILLSEATDPFLHKIGQWGNRSFRSLLLGGPQQYVLTHTLGGHRPDDGSSRWRLGHHGRAVSGHTFYGTVPLINAAKVSNSRGWTFFWYTLSTIPGIARLDSNKHYFSQILMGWGLAYLSASSVEASNTKTKPTSWYATPLNQGLLLTATHQF